MEGAPRRNKLRNEAPAMMTISTVAAQCVRAGSNQQRPRARSIHGSRGGDPPPAAGARVKCSCFFACAAPAARGVGHEAWSARSPAVSALPHVSVPVAGAPSRLAHRPRGAPSLMRANEHAFWFLSCPCRPWNGAELAGEHTAIAVVRSTGLYRCLARSRIQPVAHCSSHRRLPIPQNRGIKRVGATSKFIWAPIIAARFPIVASGKQSCRSSASALRCKGGDLTWASTRADGQEQQSTVR